MSSPIGTAEFISIARKSGLLDEKKLRDVFPTPESAPAEPQKAAAALVRAGVLTGFQAKQLLLGKYRGFLLGPYKILDPIGKGGMGTVFLAEHSGLRRRVAIKVLPTEKAENQLTLERFHREARAAAALDHPNIVRLHDISQGGGVHFIVMEFVDGTDLQSLMAKTGPLHYAQAAQYIAMAAAGLAHAHEKGFVHRDIKPANLILTKDGQVKILDMGLARSVTNADDDLTGQLGDSTDVAGTADYISPEQALNDNVDERSDIYSLGATFFSLITGHPPFRGSTAQKLMQHQAVEPPKLSKLKGVVPPALSDVVAKMMAKKKGDRYRSANDVIDALGPWLPAPSSGNVVGDSLDSGDFGISGSTASLRGKPKTVRDVRPGRPGKLANGRKSALIAAVIGGVVLLAAAATAVVVATGKTQSAAGPATSAPTAKPTAAPNPPTTAPTPANTDPLPPPPVPGRVIYTADFAKVSTFDATYKFPNLVAAGTSAALPLGWRCEVWNKESDGQFRASRERDQVVISLSASSGPSAAQIVFDPKPISPPVCMANRDYVARFEYRLDVGHKGFASAQTTGDWKHLGRVGLTSGNEWKIAEIPFRLSDGQQPQFCIGASAMDPTRWVHLRAFEIREGKPGDVIASIPPPAKALSGRSVYEVPFAAIAPFKATMIDKVTKDTGWATRFPAGLQVQCWKKESVAEFRAEMTDAGTALGVTNLNDELSSQFQIYPESATPGGLKSGAKYRVRVEYRAANDAHGTLRARGPMFDSLASVDLPATGASWRSAEFTVGRPADKPIHFGIENHAIGEGNTLWIRKWVVEELAAE